MKLIQIANSVKCVNQKFNRLLKYCKWLLGLKLKTQIMRRGNWVFSRTACLGNDSFAEYSKKNKVSRFNLQKSRIDLLLANPKNNTHYFGVSSYVDRKDVVPLVWIQPKNYWRKMQKPKFILIDSFSELTDVKFVHKKTKAYFFCHKSDLALNLHDNQILKVEGLLDLADVKLRYAELFQTFYEKWGDVKILFIHYPNNLESRTLFLTRSKQIRNAIEELEDTNPRLYSIKIPENLVAPQTVPNGELSSFPYHYSSETYSWVSKQMTKILEAK